MQTIITFIIIINKSQGSLFCILECLELIYYFDKLRLKFELISNAICNFSLVIDLK